MFVTPQDLIDAFGEQELIDLTDRATPRTYAVDTAVAQRACDRADAEVQAVLAGRYALPLATVPALLRYLAQDLARFFLYTRAVPDDVKARYEAARTSMRDIGAGRAQLGLDAAGVQVTPPPVDLPVFNPGQKAWGRESA